MCSLLFLSLLPPASRFPSGLRLLRRLVRLGVDLEVSVTLGPLSSLAASRAGSFLEVASLGAAGQGMAMWVGTAWLEGICLLWILFCEIFVSLPRCSIHFS